MASRELNVRRINIDVFVNPEKYLVRLPIEKIVADTKVIWQVIERYKKKIANGEYVAPIIVIKDPRNDVYAVLDGHHRYYAYLELGRKEINCALAGNFSGVIFYLTKHGFFQLDPLLTAYSSAFFHTVRHLVNIISHAR